MCRPGADRTGAPGAGRHYWTKMRRGFYSASAPRVIGKPDAEPVPLPPQETKQVAEPARGAWRKLYTRHERPFLFFGGIALAAAALFGAQAALAPPALHITQEDIDQAVARTLETRPLPSPAVKAY